MSRRRVTSGYRRKGVRDSLGPLALASALRAQRRPELSVERERSAPAKAGPLRFRRGRWEGPKAGLIERRAMTQVAEINDRRPRRCSEGTDVRGR